MDYTVKDGVAVIKFNNKNEKVNSLGEQVSLESEQIFNEVLNNNNIVAAVLISGKTDNFIVGADIKMLEKVTTAAEGEKISRGKIKNLCTCN